MGDPRKLKKKYSTPSHPWQASRLEEEAVLVDTYGLKNKKEIWKAASFLRGIKKQAKILIASTSLQYKKEEKQLLQKLQKLNLLPKEAKIEDALDLQTTDILNRRLQTQIFKQGFARTPNQARQFIIHRHISVSGHRVNIPSYMLTTEEETKISFSPSSKFKDEEHPERKVVKKEKTKIVRPLRRGTDRAGKRHFSRQPFRKEFTKKVKEEKKEVKEVKENE